MMISWNMWTAEWKVHHQELSGQVWPFFSWSWEEEIPTRFFLLYSTFQSLGYEEALRSFALLSLMETLLKKTLGSSTSPEKRSYINTLVHLHRPSSETTHSHKLYSSWMAHISISTKAAILNFKDNPSAFIKGDNLSNPWSLFPLQGTFFQFWGPILPKTMMQASWPT